MKPRLVAIIAIVAVVGALVVSGIRFALMGDVPADDFNAFIRDNGSSRVESQQTSARTPLPLLVAIRFPESSLKGGLGFPDRNDVYTLASSSGHFECHAHIRRDRVCLVTFDRSAPPADFRDRLAGEFPELSVR
jgi:hypothetical protein